MIIGSIGGLHAIACWLLAGGLGHVTCTEATIAHGTVQGLQLLSVYVYGSRDAESILQTMLGLLE